MPTLAIAPSLVRAFFYSNYYTTSIASHCVWLLMKNSAPKHVGDLRPSIHTAAMRRTAAEVDLGCPVGGPSPTLACHSSVAKTEIMSEFVVEGESWNSLPDDSEECDCADCGGHNGEEGVNWEELPELKLSFHEEVVCFASNGAITYEATKLEAKSSNCPMLSYDAMEFLRKKRSDLPFEILVQRERRQQTK